MQNVNQIQRIMKCFDCFRGCFKCSCSCCRSDVVVTVVVIILLLLLLQRMQTYLKLKSGEAQRTATLGICGTKRMAHATWLRHKRIYESFWLSVGIFLVGAEPRSKEARLSLTGLQKGVGLVRVNWESFCLYLRRIYDAVQCIETWIANGPGLCHSRRTLLQHTMPLEQSKEASCPGIKLRLRWTGSRSGSSSSSCSWTGLR